MRATFVDYYELLEVHPQASSAEIKAAYRACMVRDHVDQNPADAEAKERMILLTQAKQVLLDEYRRRAFDRARARWQLGGARPRWAPQAEYEGSPLEVELRDVSITRLIVGVGVAAVVTGLGLAARVVADRAGRKRRSR